MATTYLNEIVDWHRRRAREDERAWRERLDQRDEQASHPSFVDALRDGDRVTVVAEVKRRSPSKGWLDRELDVTALTRDYEVGGASAVSVLTDREFFGGSMEDLADARRATSLPLLRKDFTVCENDVLDAADAGASAVLVIVAAVSDDELASFLSVAASCGLDVLVEVHDEFEVARALDAGARVIGVNQRDLRNFDVDRERAASLVDRLPQHCLKVCESGLTSIEDVRAAAAAGFDAVLIGEAFVRSADRCASVSAMASVVRNP